MPKTKTKSVPRKKPAQKKRKSRTSVQDEFRSESRYMVADDVQDAGGEVVLTVAESKREKMPDKGEIKRCLFWEEPDFKPLPLNKTNGRFLMKNVSQFAEDWPGAQLRLYLVDTSKGPGVRFDLADDVESVDDDEVENDFDDDIEDEDDDLD